MQIVVLRDFPENKASICSALTMDWGLHFPFWVTGSGDGGVGGFRGSVRGSVRGSGSSRGRIPDYMVVLKSPSCSGWSSFPRFWVSFFLGTLEGLTVAWLFPIRILSSDGLLCISGVVFSRVSALGIYRCACPCTTYLGGFFVTTYWYYLVLPNVPGGLICSLLGLIRSLATAAWLEGISDFWYLVVLLLVVPLMQTASRAHRAHFQC